MNLSEAGRAAFVCYRQLDELVRVVDGYGAKFAEVFATAVSIDSYNRILARVKECVSADPVFAKAIEHLQEVPKDFKSLGGDRIWGMLKADASVLRATLHTFIELYLTAEEKKKVIGFQA